MSFAISRWRSATLTESIRASNRRIEDATTNVERANQEIRKLQELQHALRLEKDQLVNALSRSQNDVQQKEKEIVEHSLKMHSQQMKIDKLQAEVLDSRKRAERSEAMHRQEIDAKKQLQVPL